MKTRSSHYVRILVISFASLLAVCSAAIHPFGQVKSSEQPAISESELQVSPPIARILRRSCTDCHSNRTTWPWYSYIAPASWLVERDVRRGRERLNLSEWNQYTFEERIKSVADIASAVKNGDMPLPQYTVIHRGAKLSPNDKDLLYQWARGERRKLKAQFPVINPRSSTPVESR